MSFELCVYQEQTMIPPTTILVLSYLLKSKDDSQHSRVSHSVST
jgi:hypothetical protein